MSKRCECGQYPDVCARYGCRENKIVCDQWEMKIETFDDTTATVELSRSHDAKWFVMQFDLHMGGYPECTWADLPSAMKKTIIDRVFGEL